MGRCDCKRAIAATAMRPRRRGPGARGGRHPLQSGGRESSAARRQDPPCARTLRRGFFASSRPISHRSGAGSAGVRSASARGSSSITAASVLTAVSRRNGCAGRDFAHHDAKGNRSERKSARPPRACSGLMATDVQSPALARFASAPRPRRDQHRRRPSPLARPKSTI